MSELAIRNPPRQKRSRDRVEAILDAADALLASAGRQAFTTSAVAAAAGMPAPAVYRYFADKDELGRALVMRHLGRLEVAIETAIAGLESKAAVALIATTFDTYVTYMRENPSQQILWFDRQIGPATVAAVQSFTRTTSARHRELAIASGSIPVSTTPTDAQILGELTDRVLELAFRDNRHGDETILASGLKMLRAAGATLEVNAA